MIRPPGVIGCPRVGPNGGIVIRSGADGVEVEVGGLGGGPAALRSQFDNDQEMNSEIVELVVGCDLTFNNVPSGAYVFVQATLNIRSEGNAEAFCVPTVRYYPGGVQTDFWEPGGLFWLGATEAQIGSLCLPIQCQTPVLVAPSATLRVAIFMLGIGFVRSGHMQAELILP